MADQPESRIESDSMGELAVPADRYWGAQTARSLMNFKIGGEKMPPVLVQALGIEKLAAARTNMALGVLDKKLGAALGSEFLDAYVKLKTDDWNSYARHLTEWEREHTLDC